MPTQRAARVGRQLLQEISTIVECELSDPRLDLVTFTGVRMTSDLRSAWVSFSCLEGEAGRKRCEDGLAHAGALLRREIGRRLRLRYVPVLHFEFDESFERAERIDKLLADTRGHDEDEPE